MDPNWRGMPYGGPYMQHFQYTPTIDLSQPELQQSQPEWQQQEGFETGEASQLPPQETTEARGKKRTAHKRLKNFTIDEDECLVSAYVNVSKDPIVGINQPHKGYWQRITDYYNEHMTTPHTRTMSSLQHRWGDIQRDTSRFCGFLCQIERRKQSGVNENDKIKEVLAMFERLVGGSFKFIHCWILLKDEPKWTTLLATLNGTIQGSKDSTDNVKTVSEQMLPPKMERPVGRDRAKKQKTNSSSSASTACLEVLQKMSMDHRAYEERQEAVEEARNDKQLQLQERQVQLQERGIQLQEELIKQHREDREERFMSANLDTMLPWVRDYYIKKQKEITAATLGKGSSDGGDC